MGFVADERDFDFNSMVSAVNQFESLKECLQNKNTPHAIVRRSGDDLNSYLAYPSADNVKCVVEFDRVNNVCSLYGDNFINMRKLTSLNPAEIGLSGEDIADRIAEDEWEEYPIDEGLSNRCKRFFSGSEIKIWNVSSKSYDKASECDPPKPKATLDALDADVDIDGVSVFSVADFEKVVEELRRTGKAKVTGADIDMVKELLSTADLSGEFSITEEDD